MLTVVLALPCKLLPPLAESETKEGVPVPSAAVQFKEPPLLFVSVIGVDDVPVVVLMVSEAGAIDSVGGALTVSVTVTVCGLPAIVMPPLVPTSETDAV